MKGEINGLVTCNYGLSKRQWLRMHACHYGLPVVQIRKSSCNGATELSILGILSKCKRKLNVIIGVWIGAPSSFLFTNGTYQTINARYAQESIGAGLVTI